MDMRSESKIMSRSAMVTGQQTNAVEAWERIYYIDSVQVGRPGYLLVKRWLDCLGAVIAMVIFALPMIIIAVLVKLDSPGPALFKQERLGINGEVFVMYKFRSMYTDAEKSGPRWAAKNDCRCTPVGRVLRLSRLDELPQLWNIMVGDMSFVGPRPERACFYEQFEKYILGFHHRLAVKPGITGLAQVNGGYDLRPEEKIVYDMEYIRTMSVATDFKCILKTMKVIFTREGAR